MASLPYADMDFSSRALAGRAEGFGRFSIGGLHGPLYSVTTLAGPFSSQNCLFNQQLINPSLAALMIKLYNVGIPTGDVLIFVH